MKPDTGVYFPRKSYAGLLRRLVVDILDGLTVSILCVAWLAAFGWLVPKDPLIAGCAAICFGYFVILKRSRFGTVGYRAAGVKIVGFDGQRPGVWSLTLRMLFLVLGPLNYLLDILWLTSDTHRQALRDKFAQTYVIRKDAEPAGAGKLIYRYYEIFGYNFLFREIQVD